MSTLTVGYAYDKYFTRRNVITIKAKRALQRIADPRAPSRVAEQLQAIYAAALR